ncbi:MAG: DUF1844 domain-containing protein [Planctomycetota bacterium]
MKKKRVDEDWKRRAEEEKAKVAGSIPGRGETPPGGASGAARGEARGASGGARPDISFVSLVSQLAAQAMAGLGQLEDPRTGERGIDLTLARESIDILGVLEEKTRGNLNPEEERMMGDLLHSLRIEYVNATRAAGPAVRPTEDAPPS